MTKFVSIHSFRGGTGKSNIVANLATLLAAQGQRVGVIDADIQSPGIHILLGLAGKEVAHSLNDYLWGKSAIQDVAHNVTARVDAASPGQIFLIPASIQPGEIARVLKSGYDFELLARGFREVAAELELDTLFIDTHPGLNEETLLSIAVSNTLIVAMRPDQQDYEGTDVTLKIARQLDVPNIMMIINKVPSTIDPAAISLQVEQTYNCNVAAVLPLAEEMVTLGSSGIFALQYPEHPVTAMLAAVAARLMP